MIRIIVKYLKFIIFSSLIVSSVFLGTHFLVNRTNGDNNNKSKDNSVAIEIIPEPLIDDEEIYLNSSKRNFSFDGFSEDYKRQLKKVFQYQENLDADYFEKNRLEENVPVIIWWTPFTMNMGSYRTCSRGHKCFFTNVRRYREVYRSRNKALLFYGPNFQLHDLPMPRLKNEHWGLLHDESPSSNYLFSFDEIIRMFNHTSTFLRHSDLSLITQHLSSVDDLESTMYLVSTSEKNRLQVEKQLAPVAYVQSDCATPSDRDTYVKALMKYIGVDSYGSCLHNKDLPQNLTNPLKSKSSEELYQILAQYKFVLAMEDAVCDDYVTSKLWRTFYVGSVPIVYGSPKVDDILPDAGTAIEVLDFKSARHLASYLNELNRNDTAYDEYLKYKRKGGVRNKFLLELLAKRQLSAPSVVTAANAAERFECLVCERVHDNMERRLADRSIRTWQANREHFGCPAPVAFSDSGVLLNDPKSRDYKRNAFATAYELEEEKIRVFFNKYFYVKNYNIKYRELFNESMENIKRAHNRKFDL